MDWKKSILVDFKTLIIFELALDPVQTLIFSKKHFQNVKEIFKPKVWDPHQDVPDSGPYGRGPEYRSVDPCPKILSVRTHGIQQNAIGTEFESAFEMSASNIRIGIVQGEFHFRWLKNSAIKIGNVTTIPLIFLFLNWKPSFQIRSL